MVVMAVLTIPLHTFAKLEAARGALTLRVSVTPKELNMKRYAVMSLAAALSVVAASISMAPCQAQFLKTLQDSLLGGQAAQQQANSLGQPQLTLVGTVNLPPAQYMMTNVQTGQGFYVTVQNGQMFLGGQQVAPQNLVPNQTAIPQQQTGGFGGMVKNGLGNFLQNQIAPQQGQQLVPNQ
jgi:hypothetical protein